MLLVASYFVRWRSRANGESRRPLQEFVSLIIIVLVIRALAVLSQLEALACRLALTVDLSVDRLMLRTLNDGVSLNLLFLDLNVVHLATDI